MSADLSANKICDCSKGHRSKKAEKKLPYILGLVIAILPKCPFCVFGYSTVLTMCSGEQIRHYTPNNFHWLPIVLAFMLIGSLVWNFKDRLSLYALILSFLGTALVAYAELFSGSALLYYIGVFFLFSSVIVNGRFRATFRRFNIFFN